MKDSDSGAMIKLTATNYTLWRPVWKNFFYCKDLFDPIEEETMKLNNKFDDVYRRKSTEKLLVKSNSGLTIVFSSRCTRDRHLCVLEDV